MMPISKIRIGDMFTLGWPYSLTWLVEEVDNNFMLVKIGAAVGGKWTSMWKKNTDKLFNEHNRIN